MSDWWSKKLSGEKPTPERRTTTPPVNIPINPAVIPQATAPVARQVDDIPPESLSEGLRRGNTKGGEATRRETSECPACGGPYLFTRVKSGGGTLINGKQPAPRCYTCGWNGMYEQGDESSWA